MKKLLVLSSIALLYASLGWAQNSSPQSSDQSSTAAADNSNANSGTIEGCLAGSEGNYTLTQDTTGTSFKLVGSSDMLKEHVGHKVAITGQVAGDSSASASDTSGANASGTSTIHVSDVKMISKQCGSGSDASQPR